MRSFTARAFTPFAMLSLCTIVSCRDTSGPQVTSVIVRAPVDSVVFGRTIQMVAIGLGDSATVAHPRFLWSSSDTTVAVADSLGLVLGTGTGTATITAELEGKRAQREVHVVLIDASAGRTYTTSSLGFAGLCAIDVTGAPMCMSGHPWDTLPAFAALPRSDGLVFTEFFGMQQAHCGLTNARQLYCWGLNSNGFFGNGPGVPFRSDTAPVLGMGGRRFLALSVSEASHLCGADQGDSIVYCVGHNDLNVLGRGPGNVQEGTVAPVAGSLRAKAVSTNWFATCAIDFGGSAWCWGSNTVAGADTGSTAPSPIRIGGNGVFASVSVGAWHACALDAAGRASCWGSNREGALGIGVVDSVAHRIPEAVTGGLTFSSIYALSGYTCGITTSADLYCWGQFVPRTVSTAASGGYRYSQPTQIARGIGFRSFTASNNYFACGVTTLGKLLCW